MMISFNEANLEVRREQVLSLRDAAGVRLRCTRGSLWLTQEGGGRILCSNRANASPSSATA